MIIMDIDGVLADTSPRMHLATPQTIDQFYDAMFMDRPIKAGKVMLDALQHTEHSLGRVVFVTGRPESHRLSTVEWLEIHCHTRPAKKNLLMRPSLSTPYYGFKVQAIKENMRGSERIELAIDDDEGVIAEYRREHWPTILFNWPFLDIPGVFNNMEVAA